jgi:hypothetical protein
MPGEFEERMKGVLQELTAVSEDTSNRYVSATNPEARVAEPASVA